MAMLARLKNLVIPLASTNKRVVFNAVRNKVQTVQEFMPGPYPKTEEERIAAAKKYGLHPAEYKPYSEDGLISMGDYPQLPYIGASQRDPNYPWDDPGERRNFNEPVHFEWMLLQEDKTDLGEKPLIAYWKTPLLFCGLVLTGFVLNHLAWIYLPRFPPHMERQLPFENTGRKHYTFELQN